MYSEPCTNRYSTTRHPTKYNSRCMHQYDFQLKIWYPVLDATCLLNSKIPGNTGNKLLQMALRYHILIEKELLIIL